MRRLEWTQSHAVFVSEIDDEHLEIFEALGRLADALAGHSPAEDLPKLTKRLVASTVGHFAHEERLMRAARYEPRQWHKLQHDHARKRIGEFAARMRQGEEKAGVALVDYLTAWLHDHTRLADRMLGAFLRNHRRGLCKVKFRAGTKPAGECQWVRASGDPFDPRG